VDILKRFRLNGVISLERHPINQKGTNRAVSIALNNDYIGVEII